MMTDEFSEELPDMNTYKEQFSARLVAEFMFEASKCDAVAEKIYRSDADIVAAATIWATSGQMANEPSISGYTPVSLNENFYPSQVFVLLIRLRTDPERAINAIRRMPGRRVLKANAELTADPKPRADP